MAAFEDEPKGAKPLQIIRLVEDTAEQEGKEGSDKVYQFQLVEEHLESIMAKVPADMKVAVVSVVGNFRTGKSFLLTFMLRYLRHRAMAGDSWQEEEGKTLKGCTNPAVDVPETAVKGFEWRGGHERMTTGIWMYSEPFIHEIMGGEKIAVLIVDTQGLFDNETTMLLTSCIFGLSTLMSSYQIYNVKERIGEDHLQQLALFSEYGRMALDKDGDAEEKSEGAEEGAAPEAKAFQKLEFLVRDWPNFEDEQTEAERLKFMDEYVHDVVMKSREHKDLMETREQIVSCFEQIACFLLPHPGTKVIKPKYDGRVDAIDSEFRTMLTTYMRRIFNEDLEPKRISGRHLTAPELTVYIKTYVKLFQDRRTFPEAKTVLQATAEANNRNAQTLAVKKYTTEMDKKVGVGKTKYINKAEFEEYHTACFDGAKALFDSMANMGSKSQIKTVRVEMVAEVTSAYEKYSELNSARNPWQNAEQYIIPLGIALVAFILRYFTDTCVDISDVCKHSSNFLGHVYVAIFTLMLIVSAGRIKQGMEYFQEVLPLLLGGASLAKQKAA